MSSTLLDILEELILLDTTEESAFLDTIEEQQLQQCIEGLTLKLQSSKLRLQREWGEKIEELRRDRQDCDARLMDEINLLALRVDERGEENARSTRESYDKL